MKKQLIVTIGLLAVSAVVYAGVWFFGTRPLQQQVQDVQDEINSHVGSEGTSDTERVDTVDGKAMVDAAVAKGNAVISGWEAFEPTIEELTTITDAEGMEQALTDQRALGDEIKANFSESTSVSLPLYQDDGTVGSTWKMETPYTFDNHGVNCLFTCKSDDGQLLAYVVTYYNADDDLFTSFNQVVTSAGNAHTKATASEDGEDHSTTTTILDWAESNDVGPSTTLTPEQEQDKADAYEGRENLQEWMQEQGYLDDNGQLTEEGQEWAKERQESASTTEDGGESE